MSDKSDALRARVEELLTEHLGSDEFSVGTDGTIATAWESSETFLRCVDWAAEHTVVRIYSVILDAVPESPELFRWIALDGGTYDWGHVYAETSGEGSVRLLYEHHLLGDYLDPDELFIAMEFVVMMANDLDDELQQRFGGRRARETFG